MSAKITITKSQKLSIFSVKSWILCYVFKPSQLLKEWLMNERVKYTARSQMRCSNLSNLSSFHKIRLALFHLSVRTVERILDFLYNVHVHGHFTFMCSSFYLKFFKPGKSELWIASINSDWRFSIWVSGMWKEIQTCLEIVGPKQILNNFKSMVSYAFHFKVYATKLLGNKMIHLLTAFWFEPHILCVQESIQNRLLVSFPSDV